MDTSDPEITFDSEGVCGYCREYTPIVRSLEISESEELSRLRSVAKTIKEYGRGREYDCLIGLSGGVDSSYIAYLAGNMGLRPLAVHLDNGWDSELAVENVKKVIGRLGCDLYTYVIDW
jgi:NH3-dependent NAD+ synthetase